MLTESQEGSEVRVPRFHRGQAEGLRMSVGGESRQEVTGMAKGGSSLVAALAQRVQTVQNGA